MPTKQPEFTGGSPVSASENPYNERGVFAEPGTVLGSLPVESRGEMALDTLDGWGSSPVTDDAASARPSDPPTTGSSAG